MISKSRFNSSLCIAAVLAACAIPGCAADTSPTGDAPDLAGSTVQPQGGNGGGPEFAPDEVLVKFKAGTSAANKDRARGRVRGSRSEDVLDDLEVVKIPPGASVSAAAQGLAADPDVASAEPNFIYHHTALPTDPMYLDEAGTDPLWGMKGNFGSKADTAWLAEKGVDCSVNGQPIYVGVIDEGIFSSHPDLGENVASELNKDFSNGGNSYVASMADPHGTHVAGTIGGRANTQGVVGVCGTGIKLVSAKFLGKTGGRTSDAVKAITYLTDLKLGRKSTLNTKEAKANVIASNNSWGGGGSSPSLIAAITEANTHGVLFIAAAGNESNNNSTNLSYPASYDVPNVIAVAAIDVNGNKPSWSNWGATNVHLGAPGVDIWSTGVTKAKTATYVKMSGTSMATPHVTGAVALWASRHPAAADTKPVDYAASVKAAILAGVSTTTSMTNTTTTNGRLDVSTF